MNEEIKKALTKRNKLYAEGRKLRAEGDKLHAEGDFEFYKTVIKELGVRTEIKWLSETSCEIQNEIYE